MTAVAALTTAGGRPMTPAAPTGTAGQGHTG